jgi:hypothetical protein
MTEDTNPFAGRTLRTPRPAQHQVEYQHSSSTEVHAAQIQWDCAEQARLASIAREAERESELKAAETREEPASKAHENRLRVAFLSIRGHTMAMWLAQRDAILAGSDATSGS